MFLATVVAEDLCIVFQWTFYCISLRYPALGRVYCLGSQDQQVKMVQVNVISKHWSFWHILRSYWMVK